MAVALAPAAITLYLAFRGGGYHAETYAGVVALLAAAGAVVAIRARNLFTGWSRPLAVAGVALSGRTARRSADGERRASGEDARARWAVDTAGRKR